MTPAIEVAQLHKRFGKVTALHALDLAVTPGTVFGLIGPNGAGKTTTLRTLVDIIRPTSGTTRVLGVEPHLGGPSLRRRIGYVPGELRLEGRMTGRQLLDFYAEVSGPLAPGAIDTLAERLAADLTRPVRTLSKGNKQKLGLIQAFMHAPKLLILDEPTSGLDPLVQREFLTMVRQARDAGQTVLLSSHVLSEIQQSADDVAVLAEGTIVAEGDVASLRLGAIRHVHARITGRVGTRGGPDDGVLARTREAFRTVSGSQEWTYQVAGDDILITGTVDGSIDPFVHTLASFEVRDLRVEEPDLEESVLRLYGGAR